MLALDTTVTHCKCFLPNLCNDLWQSSFLRERTVNPLYDNMTREMCVTRSSLRISTELMQLMDSCSRREVGESQSAPTMTSGSVSKTFDPKAKMHDCKRLNSINVLHQARRSNFIHLLRISSTVSPKIVLYAERSQPTLSTALRYRKTYESPTYLNTRSRCA